MVIALSAWFGVENLEIRSVGYLALDLEDISDPGPDSRYVANWFLICPWACNLAGTEDEKTHFEGRIRLRAMQRLICVAAIIHM